MVHIILLLIFLSFGTCNLNMDINFLAISLDRGSLVPAHIKFEGVGDKLFLRVLKITGTDTQRSFLDAYTLANPGCNVYVDIDSDVEGGSGGLLFYILMKYRTNQTGATGGIDSQGNILPISGLYEKILVGSKKFDNFVVPVGSIYQYYVTKVLPYNITYVSSIDDLIYVDGRVYGKSSETSIFRLPRLPKSESKYNNSIIKPIYNELREFFTNIPKIGIHEIDNYYDELVNTTDNIANMGYYYTAANFLFLASAEKNALYYLHTNQSPSRIKDQAKRCLDQISIRGNSENDIAALTRYQWAKQALDRNYNNMHEQRFQQYYDYTQSYLWCRLAISLYEDQLVEYSSDIGNLTLDWLILGFENLEDRNMDRYKIALHYIVSNPVLAAYNLAFVVRKDPSLKDTYRSTWANIYASQAQYLRETGGDSTEVVYLANNLETIFGEGDIVYKLKSYFDRPKIGNYDLLRLKNLAIVLLVLLGLYMLVKLTDFILRILLIIIIVLAVVMML
ncbi:MAG: hypothetical protein QXD88_01320 [Candidatus Anstonellales archaeon]